MNENGGVLYLYDSSCDAVNLYNWTVGMINFSSRWNYVPCPCKEFLVCWFLRSITE